MVFTRVSRSVSSPSCPPAQCYYLVLSHRHDRPNLATPAGALRLGLGQYVTNPCKAAMTHLRPKMSVHPMCLPTTVCCPVSVIR